MKKNNLIKEFEHGNSWYFLNTGINTGQFNMDCDLFLLNKNFDLSVLRVYAWDEPTLSLGVSQKEENAQITGYPVVKRITGGQAVLHGTRIDELTYSVVLKTSESFKKVYVEIGNVLINFLEKYDLKADFGHENKNYFQDFNCFDSKTSADIVVNDVKVIGSAQYRKNDCLLQHGSIRLDLIRKFSDKNIDFDRASYDLKDSFEEGLKIRFIDLESLEYEKIAKGCKEYANLCS